MRGRDRTASDWGVGKTPSICRFCGGWSPDGITLFELKIADDKARVHRLHAVPDAICESAPSLLVSDIGMPGEDGYALIARVRALPPDRGGRIPAVAVTAFTRAEDRVRALRAAYTAHVGKPIDPGELGALATNVAART